MQAAEEERDGPAVEAEKFFEEARVQYRQRCHRVRGARPPRVQALREDNRAEDAQDANRVVHGEEEVAVQAVELRDGNIGGRRRQRDIRA